MNTEIYYFSGTGNSLVVARELAVKMYAVLIHIASVIDKENINSVADIIGIIFPVYNIEHDGIPLIVSRFIKKLNNINNKYIFAVCTFGGGSYKTLDNLNELIISRGGKLSAGFGVHMPQNAFYKFFDNNKKIFKKWRKKSEIIYKMVKAKRTNKFDNSNLLVKLIMIPFIKKARINAVKTMQNLSGSSKQTFSDLILISDKSYTTDKNCIGCGICSKVCPVNNIKLVKSKPIWQHNCETCLACFNWCPKQAIHGGIVSLNGNKNYHYHHPDVKLTDMLNRRI